MGVTCVNDDFAEMRRYAQGQAYDEQALPDLATLRLVTRHQGRIVPTVGGLLPFGLVLDDLRQGVSRLRNRVIGRVFHEIGLIEQWGSGIQRMTAACLEAGLAAPELDEVGLRFRVTLRTATVSKTKTDAIDQAILDLLSDDAGHTTAAIARHIGRTPRATRTRLLALIALIARAEVQELGTGPRDPKRRYYLRKTPGSPQEPSFYPKEAH